MISIDAGPKVFMALEPTDMRKSIDGLSILVADHLSQDPFSGHAFVFSNRSRNIVKILIWDRNGFWLLQKRLEKHRFRWPASKSETMELSKAELRWLLDGLDPKSIKGHEELRYSDIY
jgi:transposase